MTWLDVFWQWWYQAIARKDWETALRLARVIQTLKLSKKT